MWLKYFCESPKIRKYLFEQLALKNADKYTQQRISVKENGE